MKNRDLDDIDVRDIIRSAELDASFEDVKKSAMRELPMSRRYSASAARLYLDDMRHLDRAECDSYELRSL